MRTSRKCATWVICGRWCCMPGQRCGSGSRLTGSDLQKNDRDPTLSGSEPERKTGSGSDSEEKQDPDLNLWPGMQHHRPQITHVAHFLDVRSKIKNILIHYIFSVPVFFLVKKIGFECSLILNFKLSGVVCPGPIIKFYRALHTLFQASHTNIFFI